MQQHKTATPVSQRHRTASQPARRPDRQPHPDLPPTSTSARQAAAHRVYVQQRVGGGRLLHDAGQIEVRYLRYDGTVVHLCIGTAEQSNDWGDARMCISVQTGNDTQCAAQTTAHTASHTAARLAVSRCSQAPRPISPRYNREHELAVSLAHLDLPVVAHKQVGGLQRGWPGCAV